MYHLYWISSAMKMSVFPICCQHGVLSNVQSLPICCILKKNSIILIFILQLWLWLGIFCCVFWSFYLFPSELSGHLFAHFSIRLFAFWFLVQKGYWYIKDTIINLVINEYNYFLQLIIYFWLYLPCFLYDMVNLKFLSSKIYHSFFLFLTKKNWSVVNLQYSVSFECIAKWFRYTHTHTHTHIHTHIYILFRILFHYRWLQDIQHVTQ